ncbi:MAG: hypothetical protein GXY76_07655 [Chloroflexi bacterium]|nr:hypothetical protein [Chloroflexota bacterium]
MYEMYHAGMAADMYRQENLKKADNRRLFRSLKRANRKMDTARDEQIPLAWSQNLTAEARS